MKNPLKKLLILFIFLSTFLGGAFGLALALESNQPVETSEQTFIDISFEDDFYPIAEFLFDRDIFTGYPDGTFRKYDNIARAELLTLLVRMKEIEPSVEEYDNCFEDVTSSNLDQLWFVPSVCYAKAQGWVKGYEGNVFLPARSSTRAEALKMIMEALFMEELSYQTLGESELNAFFDSNQLHESIREKWYIPYYFLAKELEIISYISGGEERETTTIWGG